VLPSSKTIKRTTTSSCDYGVASHPTQYNGVNYRSRLEAKWAAFFDVLEWKFQYEPIDFSGWSPDFLIMGHRNVYVEVKPIVVSIEPVEIIDKLLSSGCNDEMLIVGMSPLARKDDDRAILGWLAEDRCFGTSVFGMWASSVIGFCHDDMTYRDRITGEHDGWRGIHEPLGANDIMMAWNEACNRVQYFSSDWPVCYKCAGRETSFPASGISARDEHKWKMKRNYGIEVEATP